MKKKEMVEFSKWLKEKRKRCNLTQQDFSELFHIPIGTLRAWEQGFQSPPDYYKFLLKTMFSSDNDN